MGNSAGDSILFEHRLASGSRVVLLAPGSSPAQLFENLLCLSKENRVLWQAKLPHPVDAFVGASLGPRGVEATSWSGYRITFDPDTGEVLDSIFVK